MPTDPCMHKEMLWSHASISHLNSLRIATKAHKHRHTGADSRLQCGVELLELTRSSRMATGKSNMHILTGWARALCRLNGDLVSIVQTECSSWPLTRQNPPKKKIKKGKPSSWVALCLSLRTESQKKEEPRHAVPPPFPRFQQLCSPRFPASHPLPRFVFHTLLLLLFFSLPGNVLTVSSCFLVFPSSRGIAQLLSCYARTTVLFAFSRLWMLRLIGWDLSQHRLNQAQNKNNNPCQTKCSSYTLRCNLNRQ